jgi:hypothetical protein
MKRLPLILAGVAIASGVAATPAIAGLAGNPSFSHEIPVPAPSTAKAPLFADDHGGVTPHAEPGDDHGGTTAPAELRDDGGASREAEPGDDHGGVTPHAEPGDDRGGSTPAPAPSDDGGGHRSGKG